MSTEKEGQGRRCPSCGHQPLVAQRIRDEFEYGPDEQRITIVAEAVPVLVCPACGEVLYGPEAAAVRHQAICRALGLLSPAEIKALRERLGPDQEDFARLTGIGVATLSRWERGRLLQTRALDRYLRLLDALPQAARFLETLQKPAQESTTFHLPPEAEAEARARAARFGPLRPPCPSSESARDNTAPEIPSPAPAAEQLAKH
ncbi:MAG TPA: type II toxin-antitoxin system MqsA family antitoxin [Gemmataceae bacterium]|jgi:HTH-type transcriptional regulator/antitoxin MqsA